MILFNVQNNSRIDNQDVKDCHLSKKAIIPCPVSATEQIFRPMIHRLEEKNVIFRNLVFLSMTGQKKEQIIATCTFHIKKNAQCLLGPLSFVRSIFQRGNEYTASVQLSSDTALSRPKEKKSCCRKRVQCKQPCCYRSYCIRVFVMGEILCSVYDKLLGNHNLDSGWYGSKSYYM